MTKVSKPEYKFERTILGTIEDRYVTIYINKNKIQIFFAKIPKTLCTFSVGITKLNKIVDLINEL